MGLLDPDEVCCNLNEKPPIEVKPPKKITNENASANGMSQNERIAKLEIQMCRLAEDVEVIKNQQCNSADAIQRAINRGVCGLGGHFKFANNICASSYSTTTNCEKSSRRSCRSSSSTTTTTTTSSSIQETNLKDNAQSPVKKNEKKVKEDDDGCSKFVLG